MIDTHAHIHEVVFDDDRDEAIRRANAAGVGKIITVGTSVAESVDAVAAAERYEEVLFAAVAVHPHEYSKMPERDVRLEWIKRLEEIAVRPKVVAIGECGLDYHAFNGVSVSEEQRNIQQEGFRDHLELARRIGKPVVIHARESYEDVLDIVRRYAEDIPSIVLHCYQGDKGVTQKFLDLSDNILFSFAGNITYPVKKSIAGTKDDVRESIKVIPLERILTETDCPYLAPQKYRGARNEPAYVTEVAKKIAEIKGMPVEGVGLLTEKNAHRSFFQLS
ncbi:MAG: TatD family hydrolase [Candidatus Moraniibacteriota bacterium]|nr:MAG: TatD family hydrolase [Candidatus Moranbacteria bacterium]